MEDTKKWFQSKTIWGGIYVVLRSLYGGLQTLVLPQFGVTLPNIPPLVDTIVGAIVGEEVIRGRITAEKQIG